MDPNPSTGESTTTESINGRGAAFRPAPLLCERPLPKPNGAVETVDVVAGGLSRARRFAAARALAHGLEPRRAEDLELSVGELAANAVRHGGGRGLLSIWREPDAVVVEMRDWGVGDRDTMTALKLPGPSAESGRGLWIVGQLSDLVQFWILPVGTVVRVRMKAPL